MNKLLSWMIGLCIVGSMAGCASRSVPVMPQASVPTAAASTVMTTTQARSHWSPVAWNELPGWQEDNLEDAWTAWQRSCARPTPEFAPLCAELGALQDAGADAQRRWMMSRLQPYRIDPLSTAESPLLTGYYEPVLEATRRPTGAYVVPLHEPPYGLRSGQRWYSRKEIDTLGTAQRSLRGREIAYVAHPADLLTLQIQGSGRALIREPDGRTSRVRLAFAGSNNHPYASVGRWLLQRGELQDASWPSIRAWMDAHPAQVQEMMWSNPRVVFFREERLPDDPSAGPVGAQGVPLTAGRSIAVDPGSIPYGTPVWLSSSGRYAQLNKLVLAQDTGSAIRGGVRADYFTGTGTEAAELAGRLKQPLQLWALWPR